MFAKAGILATIGAYYKHPKKIFADCTTGMLTVFKFDGTSYEEKAGFTDRLTLVAKAYGFKTITKIGIEFETEQIVLQGTDKKDLPKLLKL